MRLSDEGRLDLHAPVHEFVEWLRAPGRAPLATAAPPNR